jgi:hypothetical protein
MAVSRTACGIASGVAPLEQASGVASITVADGRWISGGGTKISLSGQNTAPKVVSVEQHAR